MDWARRHGTVILYDAAYEAYADAGIDDPQRCIEAVFCGAQYPSKGTAEVADALKLYDRPVSMVVNYCATGTDAFRYGVFAVASGKGGVGKSSVTANLAAAMAADGLKVGVIDADVYGFSIPKMIGADQDPTIIDGLVIPPVVHGVAVMSMGFLVDEDRAIIWRGPMLHKALEQFLTDVYWDEPDFLLVDMPPGTGDIAISLSQYLPRGEVYVVTTPQAAAQKVARLSAAMAEELLMRGFVFAVIRRATSPVAALFVTSVTFSLLHVQNAGANVWSLFFVGLAGVFLGGVLLVTGSLYAAWIAHFSWNWTMAAIFHTPVSGLSLEAPGYRYVDAGPDWATGGEWGPEGSVLAGVGMLGAIGYLYARRFIRRENG